MWKHILNYNYSHCINIRNYQNKGKRLCLSPLKICYCIMTIIQYGQSIISSFIKKKNMVCQSVNYCAILDLPLMIVQGLIGKVQIWGTMIFREQ